MISQQGNKYFLNGSKKPLCRTSTNKQEKNKNNLPVQAENRFQKSPNKNDPQVSMFRLCRWLCHGSDIMLAVDTVTTISAGSTSQCSVYLSLFLSMAAAYPPLRCSTLGQAPGLTHKHQTRQEWSARAKHSNLLPTFIIYGCKGFVPFTIFTKCFMNLCPYSQHFVFFVTYEQAQ